MSDYLLSEDEWLLIPYVALVLNVSVAAAYGYAKTGKLPGVLVIGKSVRVSKRALEKWLGRQLEDVAR